MNHDVVLVSSVAEKFGLKPFDKAQDKPVQPPLDGAKSLREALAKITGQKFTPPPAHAPDLKETLHTVAPSSAKASQGEPKAETKPAGLPEEVLREMLAVDDTESPFERPDK